MENLVTPDEMVETPATESEEWTKFTSNATGKMEACGGVGVATGAGGRTDGSTPNDRPRSVTHAVR